jgi:hypothetical protein
LWSTDRRDDHSATPTGQIPTFCLEISNSNSCGTFELNAALLFAFDALRSQAKKRFFFSKKVLCGLAEILPLRHHNDKENKGFTTSTDFVNL